MIVEIVPARRKGVRDYISVGRQSDVFGNPWVVGEDGTAEECVESYRAAIASNPVTAYQIASILVNRATNIYARTGRIRIACPCNGCFADPPRPCHAPVVAGMVVEAFGGEVRVWKPEEVAL